jgi:hypothetical protein
MRKLGLLLFMLICSMLFVPTVSSATPTFNDPGFASTWNRVDKPVADLPNPGRGYTWGPLAPGAENIATEPYNNSTRKIQYFDKARMEINDPGGNPANLYYVTTGLLVKEMVGGLRQDGDNQFTPVGASSLQVAGDSNLNGANANAPSYASFRAVATIANGENTQTNTTGSLIKASLDKSGKVSQIAPPEQRFLSGYDEVTHHNIADVFVEFGNQQGLVWNGSSYVTGQVFFGNPTYVLGRPITEPYWGRTLVAGIERDVLVQLFERRVLTYTPANPVSFRVEMGNVGQHYYRWRYQQPHPVLIARNTTPANYLFWISGSRTSNSIYGYDFSKKAQFLVKENIPAVPPLTGDGTTLVWLEDYSNYRIQGYDIKTRHEFTIVADNTYLNLNSLVLYNGVLYYNDENSNHKGFFARTLATGQEKQIFNKPIGAPVIADGVLLWKDVKFIAEFVPPEISLHLLKLDGSQGDTMLVTAGADFSNYGVAGDKVVWSFYPPATDTRVYLYSIKDKTSKAISTGRGFHPILNSKWVIWTNEEDTAPGGKNSIEGYDLASGALQTLVAHDNFLLNSSLTTNCFAGQNTLVFLAYFIDGNQLYTLELPA